MPDAVVTGIGLATPLAMGREATWQAVLEGRCGLKRTAEGIDGGPVSLPENHEPHSDLISHLAERCAEEAIAHAGLGEVDPLRAGVVIGTSKGGLRSFRKSFAGDDPQGVFWEAFQPSEPARIVAGRWGFRAASLCPVAACATGLVSLIRGAELIREGQCDVVLAGSSDASLLPMIHHSFARLKVLARGYEDPSLACRPFHRERNGFLIGEGAGVLVLESAEHAAARGAVPLARYLAGGFASDPAGITQVSEHPESLVLLLTHVLARGNRSPADIGYLNLHGTGTRSNDLAESAAVRRVFAGACDDLPASSLKGAIGHLLGAAGSVETALSLLALRDGVLPPTLHLDDPDPECQLDHITTPREKEVSAVMKTSLGFGGHLAAAIFERGG